MVLGNPRLLAVAPRIAEMMNDVVGHDHGTVDEDAKVNCADREKSDRNLGEVHQHQREQEREWNREDDQRGDRWASQEDEQHQHHERNAHEDAVADRLQRARYEKRAVVKRLDAHALGKHGRIQLLDFILYAVEHLRRIFAATQQHDSFDRLVHGSPC